jgi:GT2 family glycosyltransferase
MAGKRNVPLPWLEVTRFSRLAAPVTVQRTRLLAMGSDPRIAVAIPSWNGLEDLRHCLDSLAAQRGVELELFVVNNGSEDGTGQFLEQAGIPHLSLPRNLGFSAAVNLGVSHTGSGSVMVLNEDAELEPDCLERLHAALHADPTLGGVQPLMLQLQRGYPLDPNDPQAVVYSHGQSLTRDGRAREDGAGLPRGESPIRRREIFGVCGAACLLRREMLNGLGGYDERYFAFYEDVDLNVRARIAGWRFQLEPDAVAWHVGQAAWRAGFRRPGADNARLVARNRIATQVKFMSPRSIPRIALVEAGSIGRSVTAGRLLSTLAGKLEALRRIPELLRTRRELRRSGRPERAREWLGVGWAQGRAGLPPAGSGTGFNRNDPPAQEGRVSSVALGQGSAGRAEWRSPTASAATESRLNGR